MTNDEPARGVLISDLMRDRSEFLARARERGAQMQRYLVIINGGGLIATYTLVGVFVKVPQFIDVFVWPAICFGFGIVAAGISLFSSILLQNRRIRTIDDIIKKLKSGEYSVSQAMQERDGDLSRARKSAGFALCVQVCGFLLFIAGIWIGISQLTELKNALSKKAPSEVSSELSERFFT